MVERIGREWVITEFYNVPYGEMFRYHKRWCTKSNTTEYIDCSDSEFKRINPTELIALQIKHLSQVLRKQLINKEQTIKQ